MNSRDVIRSNLKPDFGNCDGLKSAKTRVVQVVDRPFSRQMCACSRLHRRLDKVTDMWGTKVNFKAFAWIFFDTEFNFALFL